MDQAHARELLSAERLRLESLLRQSEDAALADREAVDEPVGFDDPAEPLTAEAADDAITASIRDRLAAIDRAEQRSSAGTFGRSVRSGLAIPDDRLEADPAAELTVDKADGGARGIERLPEAWPDKDISAARP
jgi:DnaK suppressor protein